MVSGIHWGIWNSTHVGKKGLLCTEKYDPRVFITEVKLTEITQSATGFFKAFSEVSLSLANSIPVTCSIAKGLSSSRYRT